MDLVSLRNLKLLTQSKKKPNGKRYPFLGPKVWHLPRIVSRIDLSDEF